MDYEANRSSFAAVISPSLFDSVCCCFDSLCRHFQFLYVSSLFMCLHHYLVFWVSLSVCVVVVVFMGVGSVVCLKTTTHDFSYGEFSRANVSHGIPQGSVLGPALFTLLLTSLNIILTEHTKLCHCFALLCR